MNMQIALNPLDNVVFSVLYDSIFRKGESVNGAACEKNTSSPANNQNLIQLQGHTQMPRAFYFSI